MLGAASCSRVLLFSNTLRFEIAYDNLFFKNQSLVLDIHRQHDVLLLAAGGMSRYHGTVGQSE